MRFFHPSSFKTTKSNRSVNLAKTGQRRIMKRIDTVGELFFFAQIEEPGTPTCRSLDRSHIGVLTPPEFANSIRVF